MEISGLVKVVITVDPETGQVCADLVYMDMDGNVIFDSGPVCIEATTSLIYGPLHCCCQPEASFTTQEVTGKVKEEPGKEGATSERPRPPRPLPPLPPVPAPKPSQPARK